MEFLKSRAFPSFFKEYAPKLIEFFGAWIDWLNLKDNSAYIIDHLSSENDIDESIDAFKTHLKYEFVNDFPEEISADLKLLLKNIFYLYNSKSSIESYEFLFRCLFNASASISYPKQHILKTSDGRWKIPHYIKLNDDEQLVQDFEKYYSMQITGLRSGAVGYISKIEVHSFGREDTIYNAILLESVTGEFLQEEEVQISNPETGKVIEEISGHIVEKYEIGKGRWTGTFGFLDSDMYIQDSFYYQDFSYIIKSTVPAFKWRTLVKKLLHPAGMNLFGEFESSGTDEEGNEIKLPFVKAMNPLDFLHFWHIIFQTYVYDLSFKLGMHKLMIHTDSFDRSIAQFHSETVDKWLYDGDYVTQYGLNDIEINEFNKHSNKHSVLLFRTDGTLINPDIINWHNFTFTEPINTFGIHGVTLKPEHHILSGNVIGADWTYHEPESNSDKNFMVFVSATDDTSNYRIRSLKLSTIYENFTDIDPTIGSSKLDDTVMVPIEQPAKWRDLKLTDFITLNKNKVEILDKTQLLKVPATKVYFDGTKYVFTDNVYEDELIRVYSYGPEDVDEYFYTEDHSEKLFTLKSATTKEFVLCFIDGKFNLNAFEISGDQLIIKSENFKTAEFYILSRKSAYRTDYYEHDNGLNFVYNSARIQPFMAYETKLTLFKLREALSTFENLTDKISWIRELKQNNIIYDYYTNIRWGNNPKPYYRTMDKILYYSSTKPEYAVLAGTNASSNVMFDETGHLINPETVDWVNYQFLETPETSNISFILFNPSDASITAEVEQRQYTLQELQETTLNDIICGTFCHRAAFETYTIDSDMLSELQRTTLGEIALDENVNRHFGTEEIFLSLIPETTQFIKENELVFIDNRKVYPTKYKFTDYGIEFNVSEFDLSRCMYEATVYQYNPGDYEQIIRTESAVSRFFELNNDGYIESNVIVFCDGLLTTDFSISGNTLAFNKNITGMPVEIFVSRQTETSGVHTIEYSGSKDFIPPVFKTITYVDTEHKPDYSRIIE